MIHDLSLGEVQSLALKAARGAGRPHGMAEEAAFAVRWLIERGFDGAGYLATLLQATDGHGEACPLMFGVMVSDAGSVPDEMSGPVHCPMLVAPFLVALCGAEGGLSLAGEGGTVRVGADGGIEGTALPDAACSVRIAPCDAPDGRPLARRAAVADDTLRVLTAFAFRTYAPATEESRVRGAGAGVSDND